MLLIRWDLQLRLFVCVCVCVRSAENLKIVPHIRNVTRSDSPVAVASARARCYRDNYARIDSRSPKREIPDRDILIRAFSRDSRKFACATDRSALFCDLRVSSHTRAFFSSSETTAESEIARLQSPFLTSRAYLLAALFVVASTRDFLPGTNSALHCVTSVQDAPRE